LCVARVNKGIPVTRLLVGAAALARLASGVDGIAIPTRVQIHAAKDRGVPLASTAHVLGLPRSKSETAQNPSAAAVHHRFAAHEFQPPLIGVSVLAATENCERLVEAVIAGARKQSDRRLLDESIVRKLQTH
jgi:hypothetical protein